MHKERLEKYSEAARKLMDKMSLIQKIGQMVQTERTSINAEEVYENHIGSVLSGGGSAPGSNTLQDWVAMNDAYWAASMKEDEGHLAIPILYGVDAIHGHNNVQGAVIFPHNIGLGAAADPELMKRIGAVTAREILATGVEWTFAPTLAVAQNLCWGRTYESYSEDPERVEVLGAAYIEGAQNSLGDDSVIACAKHWLGDGATCFGVDQGDACIDEDDLRNIHLRPYYKAIEAGVLTVMVSFNSWKGLKCHGNSYLVKDVLKNELGFEGFTISDWDGIDYLNPNYGIAVKEGINAGLDMFMVATAWREFIAAAADGVAKGEIDIKRLDDAVFRILRVKMAYGLFEKPRPQARKWSNSESFGCAEHRELAEEAVSKSLVLLKNDDHILPLKREQRILVAGKNANNVGHQCGGFTIAWQGMDSSAEGHEQAENFSGTYYSGSLGVTKGLVAGATSVWEGIKSRSTAAKLNEDGSEADPEKHDVAVVVIGETPYAEGMGDIRTNDLPIEKTAQKVQGLMKVLHAYGHSTILKELHPEDLEIIRSIRSKGIPVVTVFIGGRPLVANEEIDRSNAFVAAWLPGSEGQGVAKVLFGETAFSGKLSFSWPETYHPDSEHPSATAKIRYPKGYGLSYPVEAHINH